MIEIKVKKKVNYALINEIADSEYRDLNASVKEVIKVVCLKCLFQSNK